MPRGSSLVRSSAEEIDINAGTTNNLFELSSGYPTLVTSTLARINKRYFLMDSVQAVATGNEAGDTTTTVTLSLRPDARGQLHKDFTFTDDNGDECDATITGNINWDTGNVIFNVVYDGPAGVTYSTNFATAKVVFSPKSGDVGRVRVALKVSGFDSQKS